MDTKQILGLLCTLVGGGALVYGVLQAFEGGAALDRHAWTALVSGFVLFAAGLGLVDRSRPV